MNLITAALEAWLEGRPETVKTLARKFPPGTIIESHGERLHVVSYDEDGGIGVSLINPSEDYSGALESRKQICKCCIQTLTASTYP